MTESPEKKPSLSVAFVNGWLVERSMNKCSLNLGKALVERGHTVQVICPGGEMEGDFRAAGMKVDIRRIMSMPILNLLTLRKTAKAIRNAGARVIHIQSQESSVFGAGLCAMTGLPGVITVHRFDFPKRLAAFKNMRIVAVSEALREYLVNDARIPKELINVVPNAVDLSRYRVTDLFVDPDQIPVVGTVGRMEPVRGPQYFVKAAKTVMDSGIKAEFVMVGKGVEEKRLRELVTMLDLTAHFTFVPESADYSSRLSSMDIVVISPIREGFGMVALEAMACGRPVIASGVGGIYSLIKDGESGLLVPPKDPDGIAERIIALLRDTDEAKRLGSNARKVVEENFTMETVAEKTEAVYQKTIESWET